MKKSRYSYFFETDNEYVGYSWIADRYVSFPIEERERVERILNDCTTVLTNRDSRIYSRLFDSKCLLSDEFDEFQYAYLLHNREIFRTDAIEFTIIPTMQCNCRCHYCYEIHDNEKMDKEVIDNIKSYIQKKAGQIKYIKIAWFGGEPLTTLDIIEEIGSFCRDISLEYDVKYISDITTNAVLLDDNACEILDKSGVDVLHVTIDGSKEMHDRTRILTGGGKTYEKVVENIKKFLDYREKNKAAIRLHVHDWATEEIEGIKKSIQEFDKYKDRASFYLKKIFNSCTEEWGEVKQDREIEVENIDYAISGLKEFLIENKFMTVEKSIRRHTSCYADKGYSWAVLPDGKLSKCTVDIEKDRIPAMLTKDGIAVNINKNSKWNKKILEGRIVNNCHDCNKLPFCWGRCPLQNYSVNAGSFNVEKCNGKEISRNIINDLAGDYMKRKENNEN